ncbi:hypothetical protein WICMUC_002926 [Wickerhamomyces mucosus]|uniref:Inosine/uridine-preferring nucleoside hydrolase domain-containing protein n=1 Tax=Wickerhamomyces mucosus TaxID=1378264 RepID=A0A9P8TDT1_9ASCO|nr:hypothetical protein WICMUC_002926 [Wickerhamomyces mucosus]
MKISSLLVLALSTLASSKKIFLDNDGLTALQLLFPLAAGHEVVGISTSFGSVSNVDGAGEAYDILNIYNLSSCIPHYLGAQQPLLRTYETFQTWETLFGELVWQGGFDPSYEDVYSWDNITYDDTLVGATALIEAVKKYKDIDPVVIYAAGMMTTVAQAISLYPNLTQEAGGLYIMGGFVDTQYAQATAARSIEVDIQTDINLIQDPEAAQIVLSADWKELLIGGNATNYVLPSQELYDRLIAKAGSYEIIENTPYYAPILDIVYTGNFTANNEQETLPFWDEVVSAYMSYPELLLETSDVACSVDTAFYSPFYGNLRIYNKEVNLPTATKTGNASLVDVVDQVKFFGLIEDILFKNWTQYCEVGGPVPLLI